MIQTLLLELFLHRHSVKIGGEIIFSGIYEFSWRPVDLCSLQRELWKSILDQSGDVYIVFFSVRSNSKIESK